ncbi:flagellar biosynthetic protein FliR [Sphingopyxis terrae]|uniref:flagellar biosynthetic protein FliR n=1 Tax=Sphingopyxis terrae TaxID=33052 RepID=UPI001C2C8886|nr:flagellar biosynthetic protein FliR [Sphingopyxis terrae]QXF13546.1 flagellar biosynthetic protein FliR [Sphingopyxis terrae subsp. terrae]
MNPADIPNIEAMLQLWMLGMIRPGAAFLAAPVFGATNVPVQLRLVIALAVGVPAVAASGLHLPPEGLVSFTGLLLVAGEVVIGLAIGFVLQMGLAAALLAGEAISNAMGLGFAAMVDPMSGQMSSAVGQFLSMLATALFLAANGHLLLIEIIVQSYNALPPGNAFPSYGAIEGILRFGSLMFAAGLTIALPVGFVLIMVQMVMGVIGRSAPAMNLFAVGLPATLLAGVILLAIATPAMAEAIARFLSDALDMARLLAGG